jgi:hypothetical protein
MSKDEGGPKGFWYSFGIHMGLTRGPIDQIVEVTVGDRRAYPLGYTQTVNDGEYTPPVSGPAEGEGGNTDQGGGGSGGSIDGWGDSPGIPDPEYNDFNFATVTGATPATIDPTLLHGGLGWLTINELDSVYQTPLVTVTGLTPGIEVHLWISYKPDKPAQFTVGTFDILGAGQWRSIYTINASPEGTFDVAVAAQASLEVGGSMTAELRFSIPRPDGTYFFATELFTVVNEGGSAGGIDLVPDDFEFTAITGATPSTDYLSEEIVITGLSPGSSGVRAFAMTASGIGADLGADSLNGSYVTGSTESIQVSESGTLHLKTGLTSSPNPGVEVYVDVFININYGYGTPNYTAHTFTKRFSVTTA